MGTLLGRSCGAEAGRAAATCYAIIRSSEEKCQKPRSAGQCLMQFIEVCLNYLDFDGLY